jgi:peptidoglycan-associated lipoprotein
MKRNGLVWLVAMLLIVPALALSACGKTTQVDQGPTTPPPDPTVEAKAAYANAKDAFVNESALFDFDRYNIRPDAAAVLDAKADFMGKYTEVAVTVEGHCDERGSEAYNMALGDRRAHSAVNYVAGKGVDINRMAPVSKGEAEPVDAGHSEEAWQKNRRASFIVTTEQSTF